MNRKKTVLQEQAAKLSELRDQLGITIKVLAAEMQYSATYVGEWCCGMRPCDMEAVKYAMKRIVKRRYEEVMKWE